MKITYQINTDDFIIEYNPEKPSILMMREDIQTIAKLAISSGFLGAEIKKFLEK